MAINIFNRVQDLAKPDGDPSKGKAFDNAGYDKALKESGYTHQEAVEYWKLRRDPFSKESINDIIDAQAPKIGVNNGKISISAPQEFFDSPVSKQIKTQLQTLRGTDLSNPEIVNSINKLNEEIRANYSQSLIKDVVGWSEKEFNDYQNAIQVVNSTNPMKSTVPIKGKGKNGEDITMSFGKWVDYYQKNYNAEDRFAALEKSYNSKNPYERIMALILAGPGKITPIYGFTTGEKAGQGWKAFKNQMLKFPEGTTRNLATENKTAEMEMYSRQLNIPIEAFRDFSITNEEQYNAKKDSLKGKAWSELSDNDKAFFLEAFSGYDLGKVINGDDDASRERISKIINANDEKKLLTFEDYKKTRDSVDTLQGYDEDRNQDDIELAKNALWSGAEQLIGNFAGVVGRFLWEDAVLRGLTGGISPKSLLDPKLVRGAKAGGLSMNAISDKTYDVVRSLGATKIGTKVVRWISNKGIPITSNLSKNIIRFTANVLGTIPEDILQTAVDNVVTYNAQENANLFSPEELSQNFKNNLIFMSILNGLKAGWKSVRATRILKDAERAAKLDMKLDIPDVDDLRRALDKGQTPKIENGKVSIIDEKGKEKTLKSITPEQAAIASGNFATVAPYFNTPVTSANYESVMRAVDTNFNNRAKRISNDLGFEIEDIRNNMGGYSFDDGGHVNELSYTYKLPDNVTPEQAKLFGSLLGDLGHEIQESVVVGKYVGDNVPDAIMEYVVKLDNVDNIEDALAKVGITDYTIDRVSNELKILIWADEATGEFDTAGIKKQMDDLENLVGGVSDERTRRMSSELIDAKAREDFYREWLDTHASESGTPLYRDVEEAYRKVRDFNAGKSSSNVGSVTDDVARTVDNVADDVAKAADAQPTVKIEVETPNGRRIMDAPDYRPRNRTEALNIKVEPTLAGVNHAQDVQLRVLMDEFDNVDYPAFQNKFGDVQPSDFNWIYWNSRFRNLSPEQIIGTVDPTTGREVTKNMIDAAKWWGEQPFTKDVRMSSRKALGYDDDYNVLGYLPHTSYDPSGLSIDEALTGQLWKTASGSALLSDTNTYKGYSGGDFRDYYRTFASNMLWDSKAEAVAAVKVMEEAAMDGVEITAKQADEVAKGTKKLNTEVADSNSVKDLEKSLLSDSDSDGPDFKKIDEATTKDIERIGPGKSIHDNWGPVFYGSNTGTVVKQSNAFKQGFDTLGNTMKNTEIAYTRGRKTVRMNMYDSGGADLVYSDRNAIDVVNRFVRDGENMREMLIEYFQTHSGRSLEHAEYLTDKVMNRFAAVEGPITVATARRIIGNSMRWEAYSRLRRFLAIAKYDEFNKSTKKMIDRFLFNHMRTDVVANNPKILDKASRFLGGLTGLRYRALFYFNIKNALLQTTELNRYFSAFKWGDVAVMAKRLATDETFRTRVDDYCDAVAPMTDRLRAELYQAYSDVADSAKVGSDGITFKNMGKKAKDAADKIGLAPIEKAESFKNRMLIAALVQEADRKGLSGDEALRHIRNRFERVSLAVDELGQIGFAANPLGRMALFLQNFQIRELGMHLYNIKDLTGMTDSTPKKILEASKYLTKVFGAKMATTLVMARLGYSAAQTLGYDPFGLMDNYSRLDDEDMEVQDLFFKSPLFLGGMTSIISDIYFMSRQAYEESESDSLSDEVENSRTNSWGLAPLSFDQLMGLGQNFVPGNVAMNRLNQMNEMMDTGWATSASGNKMYTAPNDPLNTALGYLFGRGATQNAQQYNQTYGDNLLQTLGRFVPGRPYGDFDPIDDKNYSDWFKGDENDAQQFNKGRYYFQNERDRIISEYQEKLNQGWRSKEEIAEAQNKMNEELNSLFDKLERFVSAYEKKHGTIEPAMVKQILNILNTGKKFIQDDVEEMDEEGQRDYNKALERYSALGLPAVGTYTGPTADNPNKEVKYQGSPQWRAAKNGYYNSSKEAVDVLVQADKQLQPIRKELRQQLSNAYDLKDFDRVKKIQRQYLEEFDQVVSPIIAAYGNSILTDTAVVDQIRNMLSSGTRTLSGDLIPRDHYAKDKYGRPRSMPFETVDIKKWAQQRFSGDLYSNPTVRSDSSAEDDIMEIRKLISQNKPQRARAKALQLKVRINNQSRSLSPEDYQWLNDFINGGQ